MVHLQGVSKWYHGHSRVLDHINLELRPGEFIYVVGGSGAGKTSLLRMLATEELPSVGHLKLFGFDLGTVSPSTLRTIRQSLGYIPQDVRLIPDLSVFDNVALSLSLAGKRVTPGGSAGSADARARIDELLEKLGLRPKRDTLARELSGGEAQRVAVARALIRSPKLIVADEPTGAQDRDHTWSMMDLFLKANLSGCTIVLATHDREIVRRVRKRCALLRDGKVHLEEPPCIS